MNYKNIKNKEFKLLFLAYILLHSLCVLPQEKTVTLKQNRITIKEAFNQIEKQTEYTVAYGQSKLDVNRRISLSLEKADIKTTMQQILKETNHSYRVNGYHIIVFLLKEDTTPKDSIPSSNQRKPTQTIRGKVVDSKTGTPVEYASVVLDNSAFGCTTDTLGHFRLEGVPVGRYNMRVSFVGYTTNVISEILVTSSKEVNLEIPLLENLQLLSEVVVRPEVNKQMTLNPMALTGGRMISMEEAARFANGFDDPARLVSAFAGVAGDPGSNAIAIRGNSPAFTQWRLEGVEIPNPTHFADMIELGGGLYSGLSSNVMGNSDFYNGAFPAEYSNALAGVFDMQMRTGNNRKHEHTFQIGLLGMDIASEGPISRKSGSSYIANYRHFQTSETSANVRLKFQDFSFKLNFPTKRFGTFALWGLGLIDKYPHKKKENPEDWETLADRQSGEMKQEKIVGGFNHRINLNRSSYIRSSLAATYSGQKIHADQYIDPNNYINIVETKNNRWDLSLNSYLNTRISSWHMNRTGITINQLMYDLDYRRSPDFGLNQPAQRISKGDGESTMFSVYSSSMIDLNRHFSTNIGLTAQYFRLNDNWTVEPRVSLKWKMNREQALAVSYGLHSRRENLDFYFIEKESAGKTLTNKYLNFSKSHHFGLSYSWAISPLLHFKVEPYYQYLFNVPVEPGTSFSTINHIDYYMDRLLVNEGTGRNYGIDVTLEQYMHKGFYYMLTGSLYKTEYKGGDGIWRNTRLDRRFIFNALAGKEWMVGKNKQNMFSLNVRLFAHGGDRYTPIDEKATMELREITYDESRAYAERFRPAVNGDLSVSYKINKKKLSHEFSAKILNIGAYTGAHYYDFNEAKNTIEKEKAMGVIFNLSYKIQF